MGTGKMVSTTDSFFTMTLCVWLKYHSAKSIRNLKPNNFHKLAKHPTQRSHSKTHWIRIENLQTKHEAWGCFKLNNTPLYNKKWVLVFFPTWNYNQYIQKKMSTCKFSTDVKFYCGTIKVYKASAWKFLWSQNQRLGCNCN